MLDLEKTDFVGLLPCKTYGLEGTRVVCNIFF